MDRTLKVLVVDDEPENRLLLEKFLGRLGHEVLIATTGEEAVDICGHSSPDMVLMDVMLPGIDGFEATRRIRALNDERWLPIIFASALGKNIDMVRGLEAGGDDYIAKPIDLGLLSAKIRAMQRIAYIQSRLSDTARELEAHRRVEEEEQEMARDLMARMIQAVSMEAPSLKLWIEPTARFSGDLLIANQSRTGHLYVLHADSMGHGLPAALTLLPAAQIFRAMTERGNTLANIVLEMNTQLKRQIPAGRFVAATLACLDRRNRIIEVWNGGNPTALFVGRDGRILQRFESMSPALGILPPSHFDASTRAWQYADEGTLLFYSDGLLDAQNAAGEDFGEARLLAAINATDAHSAIRDAVLRHLDGRPAHDDISLMSLGC